VRELLVDFFLPETDRGAVTQWIVMAIIWVVVLVVTHRLRHEYRLFIAGLIMINIAWFAVRTVQ
jgi:hypothetical protein